jgi:hypothetical protein
MNRNVAIFALAFAAPLAVAGPNPDYPTENVAQFVVEKLDATSLPAALRPGKAKDKKTFADYGYAVQKVDDRSAILESGNERLAINVLEQDARGIYLCVSDAADGSPAKTQSVVVAKRKDAQALLKLHSSFREFASCPAIGAESESSSYGG